MGFLKGVSMLLKAVIAVYSLLVVGLVMMLTQTTAHSTTLSGPDLIVREDLLAHQWVVRDENLSANACSVIEGEVTPGLRRLLRFTVMTPNVGDTDINLGDPNDHVAANDGLYEFASCHRHFHFRHYATYELIDGSGQVWRAAKRGFCMLDTDPNPAYFGQSPRQPQFRSCGAVGIPGNQGISAGWADTYRYFLAGQYFVLDGGDGQPEVPPGDYIIRITVNPGFVPAPGESIAFASPDPLHAGVYHQLFESNYENNIGEFAVTIPNRVGRSGFGPLAGSNINTIDGDEHDPPVK